MKGKIVGPGWHVDWMNSEKWKGLLMNEYGESLGGFDDHKQAYQHAAERAHKGKRGSRDNYSHRGKLRAGWPQPLNAAALHGLAGDIVDTIEPASQVIWRHQPRSCWLLLAMWSAIALTTGAKAHVTLRIFLLCWWA